MKLCNACGAEMVEKEKMNVCLHCGNDEMFPVPTAPVESLSNLCRSCLHPMNPEHSEFGCNMPGCSCTHTESVIVEPRDVLPNAGDRQQDFISEKSGKLPANPKRGMKFDYKGKEYTLVEADEYPIGTPGWWAWEPKEAKNAGSLTFSTFCLKCKEKLGGKSPDGMDGFVKGNVMHVAAKAEYGQAQALCGEEFGNSENSNATPHGAKGSPCTEPGCSDGIVKWCNTCGKGFCSKHLCKEHGAENSNAAPNALIGEAMRSFPSGYIIDPDKLDSFVKLVDEMYPRRAKEIAQEAIKRGIAAKVENTNASPDFQSAIAAFEAHCESCPTCGPVRSAPAGAPESDASKLCPTGSQLLVADLENSKDIAACMTCGKQFKREGPEDFQEGRPEGVNCPECSVKEKTNADAGKCICGQPKRDQSDQDYHTPGSDRCKQIQSLSEIENAEGGPGLYKCQACGLEETLEEDLQVGASCPKCGAGREKLVKVNANADSAPSGWRVISQWEDEKDAKKHSDLILGSKVEKGPTGAFRVLVKMHEALGNADKAGYIASLKRAIEDNKKMLPTLEGFDKTLRERELVSLEKQLADAEKQNADITIPESHLAEDKKSLTTIKKTAEEMLAEDAEAKNARMGPMEAWERKIVDRSKLLGEIGKDLSLSSKSWSELPADVQIAISDALAEKRNDASSISTIHDRAELGNSRYGSRA